MIRTMADFVLDAPYAPTGDQPRAIAELVAALKAEAQHCTLLGVTGSGKTFTMANVIAALQRPTMIISHNKTLAAQLYSEFKGFFPDNAVEYFVSYYDYYQPEAYVPAKDLYIEKESAINEEIDKLRLSATRSVMSRRDVIVVASVSAIYGLGSPKAYEDLTIILEVDAVCPRDDLLRALVAIQYERRDLDLQRGRFRVRGDVVDIWPAYDDHVIRVSFFDDLVEDLAEVHPLTGAVINRRRRLALYPAKHFVVDEPTMDQAIAGIAEELEQQHRALLDAGALVEAQRLRSRTLYDIEMLREAGYCSGIENYSRFFAGQAPGARPYCLYDFFPPDFLTIIDESHVTLPQLRGMYAGDRSRKQTLVEHGFRLPSALDNRPLRFDEWEALVGQRIYVSATPGPYEETHEQMRTEQLIRPTGLLDPEILVLPTAGQVEALITAVRERAERGERTLVTTLTKRLAEDLSEFLHEAGIRTTYLHSDIDALERIEILHSLRQGHSQCLVGVNLLREGLDLPEVSLVAIFDADQQGFLRSAVSLIQTIGRAARHVAGTVLLFADHMSPAMQQAISETERRRRYQEIYNQEHGIIPRSVTRSQDAGAFAEALAARRVADQDPTPDLPADREELRLLMLAAAERLDFETAATLRDRLHALEGEASAAPAARPRRRHPGRRRRR